MKVTTNSAEMVPELGKSGGLARLVSALSDLVKLSPLGGSRVGGVGV